MLDELDKVGSAFGLRRFGAAPGLKELRGREVLFGAYMNDIKGKAAMDITDIQAPGKILLRVYGDYFDDRKEQLEFIGEVGRFVEGHGGRLRKWQRYR